LGFASFQNVELLIGDTGFGGVGRPLRVRAVTVDLADDLRRVSARERLEWLIFLDQRTHSGDFLKTRHPCTLPSAE